MSETISPNSTIAQYTIVSKIGEGGMGEVWRARDPKLGRDVAIKVLPASLSENEERLRRFEQEAQAAGALNHPNILVIYHIAMHDGAPYIVSELLEGEELRDRLNQGPIPLRKVFDYAQQIVSGLSVAHEKGIVHRDLKPENLFVTKDDRVKILDFGLAKLSRQPQSTSSDISEDSTRRVLTNPGVVIGTVGYMSPEQVRGQPADHRSDIFSFGAILHEMITGRRAFRRETIAETMTAILKEEPEELSTSKPNITPSLERIVNRCLEKKPERRFQSTADLSFALEGLGQPTTSSSGRELTSAASVAVAETNRSWGRGRLPWIAAGALALALIALSALYFSNRAANETRAVRLSFIPPTELAFNDKTPSAAVVSPDGQKIAFTATSADGKIMMYVRNLDLSETKVVPGSENALEPFWSPDSRSVAFGSNGKLKRSDLSGANAQVVCDAGRLVGGTWNKEGTIVFAPDYGTTLMQVSAQGGEPRAAIAKSMDPWAERHRYPYFLPDGHHFLFYSETIGIGAASLDSPEVKQILPDKSRFVYAPQGFLIFVRDDALVAQAFDSRALTLTGDPVPIITGQKTQGTLSISVSAGGILVWQPQWERDYQLVWFDRQGKQIGTVDAPRNVFVGQDPDLSPDGKRVVVRRDNNLWVIDLEKGTGLRITSTFGQAPLWSPDGSRILYNGGADGISVKAANGLGEAQILLKGANFPVAWSPDGRFIIFEYRGVKTRMDLWALPTFGDRKEYLLLNSSFDEQSPRLSPDGHWLAYSADDTGDYEIYVQSFSADGKLGADKKRVSTTGGRFPVWRHDGSELFFVADDGQMMSSSVKTGGTEFEFAAPKPLFKTRMLVRSQNFHEFDVSPDGQRFVIGTLVGDTKAVLPTVILNWTAELKK